MTSRERMAAAMGGGTPDRVPVMCQFSVGHMLTQLGVSPAEFWNDPAVYVDGLFRMREIYEFDGILVSLHGHDPDWRSAEASRLDSPEGEVILWKDGSSTEYPVNDLPRHRPGIGVHAPPEYIPVSQGLRFRIHPDHRFDVLVETVRRSAGRYSVHGEITSPFDYVLDQGGHQAVLLALLDDPASVKRALGFWTAKAVDLARGMCGTGVDAIKISSPFAGAGFISPACYAEFVLPYERNVISTIRENGVRAYLHTCGAIRDRLELMIASGTDGIECLDPPPLGNVELGEALDMIGGRCFVKGNVDSVNVLLRGTPEEITADVKARLDIAGSRGGFILSTACSIAPGVPREHVRLLREAVGG
ncbi:MAG TPA: uroporphyrinogen decarboxylase family protein [Bacteroidota bacterium]